MFDHIDIISTQFLTLVWVAAGIAIVWAGRSLRRADGQRLLRGGTLTIVALLTLVIASADTVNAHFAFLPTAGDVRAAINGDRQWMSAQQVSDLSPAKQVSVRRSGTIVRMKLPPDPLHGFRSSDVVAYLPSQYFANATERFPVVYLFHGSPGRPADWFHGGEAAQVGRQLALSGHPTILVAPQVSRSWTDDPECLDGVQEKVESHVVDDVVPSIDRMFRTVANRDGRVFAGMSAGGYCALNLGLRHRDLVATIVDLSGFTAPTHTGGLRSVLGSAYQKSAPANTPSSYAATLARAPATRVWLDSGSADKTVLREMTALAPVLAARGFDVQWRTRPGGHTFWVWTAALQESLPWAIAGNAGKPTHDPSHTGPTPH